MNRRSRARRTRASELSGMMTTCSERHKSQQRQPHAPSSHACPTMADTMAHRTEVIPAGGRSRRKRASVQCHPPIGVPSNSGKLAGECLGLRMSCRRMFGRRSDFVLEPVHLGLRQRACLVFFAPSFSLLYPLTERMHARCRYAQGCHFLSPLCFEGVAAC